jgi:ribosomal protein S18 acetylase RimI-like enzyme
MESYVVAEWEQWSDEIVCSQLLDSLDSKAFQSIFVGRSRVGVIVVEHHATHIQIEDLYILPEFQNQGIGAAIILDIIEDTHQDLSEIDYAAGRPC